MWGTTAALSKGYVRVIFFLMGLCYGIYTFFNAAKVRGVLLLGMFASSCEVSSSTSSPVSPQRHAATTQCPTMHDLTGDRLSVYGTADGCARACTVCPPPPNVCLVGGRSTLRRTTPCPRAFAATWSATLPGSTSVHGAFGPGGGYNSWPGLGG